MIDKRIVRKHHATFEAIRHADEADNEFWTARELAEVLEYSQYRHFLPVIERAREACRASGRKVSDHFEDVLTMVEIGSGAQREIEDVRLSRYACYLIVQNGDPAKPVIALGQTYFAIQTRRQELADDERFAKLSEDDKRLAIRNELATHNKHLAAAAKDAGVVTPLDYAIFQDHGYKGLYGGLTAKDIHARKGLKKSQKILDHMGSTELAANLFRATQADEKLKRERVRERHGKSDADSEVSWTVDFAARRDAAREAMAPHLAESAACRAELVQLKEQHALLRRNKAGNDALDACRELQARAERGAREAQAKADAIDAACFDLKAVNPRARDDRDARTPEQVLESIAIHGRTIEQALDRLRKALAEDEGAV